MIMWLFCSQQLGVCERQVTEASFCETGEQLFHVADDLSARYNDLRDVCEIKIGICVFVWCLHEWWVRLDRAFCMALLDWLVAVIFLVVGPSLLVSVAPLWTSSCLTYFILIDTKVNLLIEHKDDLAKLMVLEQGKPLAEATGEVIQPPYYFSYVLYMTIAFR